MAQGFFFQLLMGAWITLKLAICSACIGLIIGLIGATCESTSIRWLRYLVTSFIFMIRGLPELLVLFFTYFGVTALLSMLFKHYVDVSAFAAGVTAMSLIFGAYASQVFQGAFMAIDRGQIEAAKAMAFNSWQLFMRIQLPQAWRYALPGLGNLWLVLLKDTAIVMLIGLPDLMSQAKIAASTTQQPFTFYLFAAGIYLLITSVSEKCIHLFTLRANRYIQAE